MPERLEILDIFAEGLHPALRVISVQFFQNPLERYAFLYSSMPLGGYCEIHLRGSGLAHS